VVANAALQSFGDVLAHDLKEPVRGIENYLLAASEEYGTDGGKRYLAEAQRSNQKLATLVDGLLILGETMRSPLHLRPVDLRTVIAGNACRALFEADAERRGATIDVDPGVPLIFGDEYLLSQLLGRVIANAIVHSGTPEPRVRVWGERESGGRARIRIADGGRGFPAPVLERFAKGAGDSLPTPHGGFGLLIASRAAERLGGRMDLENERNGMATAGACVNILLPVPELEDPPRAALATRSGSPTEERPPRSTGSSGARSG
jgi:signal transduction histidine kinase